MVEMEMVGSKGKGPSNMLWKVTEALAERSSSLMDSSSLSRRRLER